MKFAAATAADPDAGVADHVGVREVGDDEVVVAAGERGDEARR